MSLKWNVELIRPHTDDSGDSEKDIFSQIKENTGESLFSCLPVGANTNLIHVIWVFHLLQVVDKPQWVTSHTKKAWLISRCLLSHHLVNLKQVDAGGSCNSRRKLQTALISEENDYILEQKPKV